MADVIWKQEGRIDSHYPWYLAPEKALIFCKKVENPQVINILFLSLKLYIFIFKCFIMRKIRSALFYILWLGWISVFFYCWYSRGKTIVFHPNRPIIFWKIQNSTAKAQNPFNDPFYLSSVSFPTTSFLPTIPVMLDGSLVTPTVIPPPPNPMR